jgi:hypothetical protein
MRCCWTMPLRPTRRRNAILQQRQTASSSLTDRVVNQSRPDLRGRIQQRNVA